MNKKFLKTCKSLKPFTNLLLTILFLTTYHLLLTNLFAGFSKDSAGTSGAQFLKIAAGARPVALGEAYGAISDDVYAIYWNPAGLGQLTQKNFGLTYTIWLLNTNYNFVAYAHPFKFGTAGLSITQLSIPSIDKYDKNEQKKDTYTASDMSINLGYGGKIKEDIFSGLNIKLIQSSIDGTATSAFALDFGFIYRTGNQSFSATVQNLGSKIKFVSQEDSLPMNIKIGTGWKLIPDKLLFAVDLNAPSDSDIKLNFGTEYTKRFSEKFLLVGRFGIKTNVRGLETISAISVGGGINWTMLNFDFAWVPYGALGDTIRASLGVKFGGAVSQKTTAAEMKKSSEVSPPTPSPAKKILTESEKAKLKRKYFTQGQEFFVKKDYKTAIAFFEKVLELDPNHTESKEYINRAKEALSK